MQQAPLDLKDIHIPDSIGWWPPAIGWWFSILLGLLLIYSVYRIYKHLTRKTALKSAKKLFNTIKNNTDIDDQSRISELAMLIRRVAMSQDGRINTASLTGSNWLQYLDQDLSEKPFSEGAGSILAKAHYLPATPENYDINPLIQITEDWLEAQSKRRKTS